MRGAPPPSGRASERASGRASTPTGVSPRAAPSVQLTPGGRCVRWDAVAATRRHVVRVERICSSRAPLPGVSASPEKANAMPVCTLDLPAEPLLTTQPPPQQQQPPPLPPPTTDVHQHKPPPIIHPSVGAAASAASPILLQQSPPSPASLSGPPSPDPSDDCNSCPHCQGWCITSRVSLLFDPCELDPASSDRFSLLGH